jgi:hypothetical protein
MQVPRVEKIVVSMGVGAAIQTGSLLDNAQRDMTLITGQKPIVTRAKKSIAGFKLREAKRSAARSRCGTSGCTSSSTGSSAGDSPYPRLPWPADKGIRRPG